MDAYASQDTCQRCFAAMEDAHQREMEELHERHQTEVAKLQEERDGLLAEETAATVAAIEAMKKAHREELEKAQRAQLSRTSDAGQLACHYEEEPKSAQRGLDVLSEQHSHKRSLARAPEAERLALRRCQWENRELNTHKQVLPRPEEAELQRQEPRSPQDKLQALLGVQHAAYPDRSQNAERSAGDKHNRQRCVTKAQAEHLAAVTEACGAEYESNAGYQRIERPPSARPRRSVKSKSPKEGLTPQECARLFEDADPRKKLGGGDTAARGRSAQTPHRVPGSNIVGGTE